MRVGILGGGQLARMLALSGHPLGYDFAVLCPQGDAPAAPMAEIIEADYTDTQAIRRLVEASDVVTFEFENVPADALIKAADEDAFHPRIEALKVAQDRLAEKTMFREEGISTAPFAAVDAESDLDAAGVTYPAILKTRRLGYDGKGQRRVGSKEDAKKAFAELGKVPCLLEGFVDFSRELSVIAARSTTGETVFYPLAENTHHDGILRISRAPANVSDTLNKRAREIATALLERLGYVGVLAVEMFEKDGELFANEIAPRVHNSGHWTQDGSLTCQFENHLRAVTGAPLGNPIAHSPTVMVNLIGTVPSTEDVLSVPGTALHLYGKAPRPGRKLGHVNVVSLPGIDFEKSVSEVSRLAGP